MIEKYQTDKDGDLMYSPETGKPMLEEGFIKRQIRKIPGAIKDLVLPGSPGFTSKPKIQKYCELGANYCGDTRSEKKIQKLRFWVLFLNANDSLRLYKKYLSLTILS